MTPKELAETVLLQLECFWLLQELDEECRCNDPAISAALDRIYHERNRPVTWRELHPFVRLKTTLGLLVVPISFASRLSAEELDAHGFSVRTEHNILFREGCREIRSPEPSRVLLVLRNALAHLPEFAVGGSGPNVSFDEGILRCWTRTGSSEVVFRSEDGFISFLRDLLPVVRKAAGALLKSM